MDLIKLKKLQKQPKARIEAFKRLTEVFDPKRYFLMEIKIKKGFKSEKMFKMSGYLKKF